MRGGRGSGGSLRSHGTALQGRGVVPLKSRRGKVGRGWWAGERAALGPGPHSPHRPLEASCPHSSRHGHVILASLSASRQGTKTDTAPVCMHFDRTAVTADSQPAAHIGAAPCFKFSTESCLVREEATVAFSLARHDTARQLSAAQDERFDGECNQDPGTSSGTPAGQPIIYLPGKREGGRGATSAMLSEPPWALCCRVL